MSDKDSKYVLVNPDENSLYLSEQSKSYDNKKDFTTLQAWIKSREVNLFFNNKILPLLPKEEKFNLDIQIRKAGVSVTASIAEGYGRYHLKEGIQFYRISRGSLYELKDHLISCSDFKYINNDLKLEGLELIETAKRILNGFINFVSNKLKQSKVK